MKGTLMIAAAIGLVGAAHSQMIINGSSSAVADLSGDSYASSSALSDLGLIGSVQNGVTFASQGWTLSGSTTSNGGGQNNAMFAPPTPAPEPVTMSLGFVGIGTFFYRRKKSRA